MNRREKVIVVTTVGVLFLAIVGVAAASSGEKKDDEKRPCGPGLVPNSVRAQLIANATRNKDMAALARAMALPQCVPEVCPDGFHRDPTTGECIATTPDDPDPKFDPVNPGEDDCPEGYVRNFMRLKLLGSGLSKDELAAELAKYPLCVPKECPPGTERNEFGECVLVQPKPPKTPKKPSDVVIIKDFPEGNAFYQVRQGDILGWGLKGLHTEAITQNVLARELFLAAREYGGLDDNAALAFANARRRNTSATNAIYDAITCSPLDDACYGTWGYCGDVAIANKVCPASMRNHPGPHGRAIRLLPQHANNAVRLMQDLPMARVVAILSAAQKGNGKGNAVQAASPGGKSSYPLLWIPGIDRRRLWESNGTALVFVDGQMNPPDEITGMGFTDYSGTTITTFGCPPQQMDFG